MTEFQSLLRALEARGKAAAKAARTRTAAALVLAAQAETITASLSDEGVVLAAVGLKARLNGSRRRSPDPVVQSLVRPGGFR